MKVEIIVLILWNIITFALMGIDKYKSQHQKWRISEKTLLLSAFALGGFGSILGSLIFRHKTKKTKFRILLPCAVIVNLAVLLLTFFR